MNQVKEPCQARSENMNELKSLERKVEHAFEEFMKRRLAIQVTLVYIGISVLGSMTVYPFLMSSTMQPELHSALPVLAGALGSFWRMMLIAIAAQALLLLSGVGLWRAKKWGLHAFILAEAVLFAFSVAMASPNILGTLIAVGLGVWLFKTYKVMYPEVQVAGAGPQTTSGGEDSPPRASFQQ